MNNYYIKVEARIPVPREREFRLKAGNMATASARAVREYRKEMKGRRIDNMIIKITKL